MAPITTNVNSTQAVFAANTRGRTLLDPYKGGPVKATYFKYTNDTGAALADGTVIDFGPVLKSTMYLPVVILKTTALGASRVLNLGYQEHTDRDGTTVAGDIDAFLAAKDVSSAVVNTVNPAPTGTSPLTIEGDAVHLLGSVTGGTIPTSAVIEGFLLHFNPF